MSSGVGGRRGKRDNVIRSYLLCNHIPPCVYQFFLLLEGGFPIYVAFRWLRARGVIGFPWFVVQRDVIVVRTRQVMMWNRCSWGVLLSLVPQSLKPGIAKGSGEDEYILPSPILDSGSLIHPVLDCMKEFHGKTEVIDDDEDQQLVSEELMCFVDIPQTHFLKSDSEDSTQGTKDPQESGGHVLQECILAASKTTNQSITEVKVEYHDICGGYTYAKPYKCDLCAYTVKWKKNLKYHMAAIHSGERPFKCKTCGEAYKLKRLLTVHSRDHSVLFQCNT
ncbi:unnamed protein product [Darwinula stevensoni]|uniref:C2H2-type domain-containing protein n=1 Tax=Darwinula stevensoni TaxID=69355 RepID=A0A7R8XDV2_9CRUS|nr:unnamed protein product [Darwinula stevensoni]CAG0889039.1 unnamed protein product [Darwinula stevensoni]